MPTATLPDARCEECALAVAPDSLVTIAEGERVCEDCAHALSFCDGCGTHARSTGHTVTDTALCDRCLAGWSRCDRCELFTREVTAVINGPDVCESCVEDYDRCDDCGARASHTETVEGGDEVCSYCRDENYHYCEGCYTLIPLSDNRCDNCYDDSRSHHLVHDYDYRPQPLFHGRGPLFLGMELELITPIRSSTTRSSSRSPSSGIWATSKRTVPSVRAGSSWSPTRCRGSTRAPGSRGSC